MRHGLLSSCRVGVEGARAHRWTMRTVASELNARWGLGARGSIPGAIRDFREGLRAPDVCRQRAIDMWLRPADLDIYSMREYNVTTG